jgi:hypothetical protein
VNEDGSLEKEDMRREAKSKIEMREGGGVRRE